MIKTDRSCLGANHPVLYNCVRCYFVLIPLLLLNAIVTSCAPLPAPLSSRENSSATTTQKSITQQQRLRSRPAYYRVKSGDTLISIARQFGLDYMLLAEWNQLQKPYTIFPGNRLILAEPKRTAAPKSVPYVSTVEPNKQSKINEQTTASRSQVKRSSSEKVITKPLANNQKKGILNWQWPTKGSVSQGFVQGDPTRKGIVISGELGQRIVAAESGRVVYAGSGLIGYGLLIIIKHDNKYLSAYGYNQKINVKEGDQIRKGDVIAEMGAKGNSNAVLHFEIRYNGLPVDPLKVLPP